MASTLSYISMDSSPLMKTKIIGTLMGSIIGAAVAVFATRYENWIVSKYPTH